MKTHHPRRALAALALTVATAALTPSMALAAATITVRVEGETATLLPKTPVQLGASTDTEPDTGCEANSLDAAIEFATGGDWDRTAWYPGPETILDETHIAFPDREVWEPWVKRAGSDTWDYWSGAYMYSWDCYPSSINAALALQEGDELLIQATKQGDDAYTTPLARPVDIAAPPVVEVGDSFEVELTAFRGNRQESLMNPIPGTVETAAGYTIAGAAANATSDSQGKATLIASATGIAQLKATSNNADDWGRSALTPVCVHDGDDGICPPKIEIAETFDIGQASTAGMVMRPVTITARRNDLEVGDVRLVDNAGTGIYLLDGSCEDSTVDMGTSCELMLLFSPTDTGQATATLEVASDAVEQPLASVQVTGTGVVPPQVQGPQGPQGQPGTPGQQGTAGAPGAGGAKGATGDRGPAGRDARVSCKLVKPRGKKQTVRCTVSLKTAGNAAKRLDGRERATLTRRGRVYATGRIGGLRATRPLAKGRYTLRIGGRSGVNIPTSIR